jgi:hypothetical protein
MWGILETGRKAVGWAVAIWHVLGWFGLTAGIAGFAIATVGAWRAAMIESVPVSIAVMVGFCVFALACHLALVPATYRALVANPALTGNAAPPPNYEALKHIHSFALG